MNTNIIILLDTMTDRAQWPHAEKDLSQKIDTMCLQKTPEDANNNAHDNVPDTVRLGESASPSSATVSSVKFEEFNIKDELVRGIYAMGFNMPSKIQEATLPTLLADPPQNMIAQSQSSTGKTAAFVLCLLSRVDATKNYPQVICLNPTYELAIQTGEVTAQIVQTLGQCMLCEDRNFPGALNSMHKC